MQFNWLWTYFPGDWILPGNGTVLVNILHHPLVGASLLIIPSLWNTDFQVSEWQFGLSSQWICPMVITRRKLFSCNKHLSKGNSSFDLQSYCYMCWGHNATDLWLYNLKIPCGYKPGVKIHIFPIMLHIFGQRRHKTISFYWVFSIYSTHTQYASAGLNMDSLHLIWFKEEIFTPHSLSQTAGLWRWTTFWSVWLVVQF